MAKRANVTNDEKAQSGNLPEAFAVLRSEIERMSAGIRAL
jgi:hypothetical protein